MAFEHYDKCSLLLPMDGANNGTTFTDWSPNPKTVTVAGNAKTVTAQSKYYGSSGYFDGTGDYLSIADDATLDLSGDFTAAVWLLVTSFAGQTNPYPNYFCKGGYQLSSSVWAFGFDNSNRNSFFQYGNPAVTLSTGILTENSWGHVAVTRSGGTLRRFLNGVLIGSSTVATDFTSTYPVTVGTTSTGASPLLGYLQDLLIINGAALWTSNFTPPARLIGTISGEVRNKDNALASRIVTAFPRTVPTKLYQTTSSAVDGTFSLRLPATESTALVMANESVMRNDIVDRIIPE